MNKITPDGWEVVDIGDICPTLGLEFLAPTGCWWDYVPQYDGPEPEKDYNYDTRNLIEN